MFLPMRVVFTLEVWTPASGGGIVFRNNHGAHLLPRILFSKWPRILHCVPASMQESAEEGEISFEQENVNRKTQCLVLV